jgi:hypothetical protein
METQKPRRNFLGLLGASLSGVAFALVGRLAPAGEAIDEPKKEKPFSGTSKKGDFNEALEAAIKAALASTHVSDAQAKWTMKEVSGIKGGIAGRNELTVTIYAIVP